MRQGEVVDFSRADIVDANFHLRPLGSLARIHWAVDTFGEGLHALTSAGIESAFTLHHLAKSGEDITVIHIDTGFLPEETKAFRRDLQSIFGINVIEVGPSPEEVADVHNRRLWETDVQAYTNVTKLEPLNRAIKTLGVSALITGIRADQTPNRQQLNFVGEGNAGEIRVNPFLDWSQAQVDAYFEAHNLPRHPLYYQGYESVDDVPLTEPGPGRDGRQRLECGLHVSGQVVRAAMDQES